MAAAPAGHQRHNTRHRRVGAGDKQRFPMQFQFGMRFHQTVKLFLQHCLNAVD
ncbi:MAG TPA: hypothetical protein VFQ52_03210 [Rhizomicrobium sp.]|nr:hypothetical protein [Rhizomicrobium sp.]